MSKYFLNRHSEQLTHGAELFELILGKDNYAELAEQKRESEYFTFQIVEEAVRNSFPDQAEKIMHGYVEMLTFDALIGHNDRHPYNWGVIVPLFKRRPPRFSPIYDTARALFWNVPERRVKQMLTDEMQFITYVCNCAPPIGWDGKSAIDFFRLIGLIYYHFPVHKSGIERFLTKAPLERVDEIIEDEFAPLMSAQRCELIKKCLRLRHYFLCEAIAEYGRKEEVDNANQKVH